MIHFGERLQLLPRALQRLRDVELRPEEESIGTLELPYRFVGKVASLESNAIQPIQLDRIPNRLQKRRNVLRHARATANEAVRADTHELMRRGHTRDDREILDHHVTSELCRVRDDDVVGDVTVVA